MGINLCLDGRPGHSRELASLRLVDTLVQQMDNFYLSISILIDLSKGFDTLGHDVMLSKLCYYGVSSVKLIFLRIISWKCLGLRCGNFIII